MEFNLKITGDNQPYKGDITALHTYTFTNGGKFPKSYIDFAEEYGYGLAANMFIVYVPMGDYGDSFEVRSEEIIITYQDVLDDEDELWFDLEPDLSYDDLQNLIPFAASENGHYLFWDVSEMYNDEYKIYITDFRGLGFTHIANSLYEFFDIVTDKLPGREKVIDFVLPATFKPYIKK